MIRSIALCLLIAVAAVRADDAKIPLVRGGASAAVVLISEAPEVGPGIRFQTSSVEEAASELVKTVKEISGAEIPVRKVSGEGLQAAIKRAGEERLTPVLLGSLARRHLGEKETAAVTDPSGFILKATPGTAATLQVVAIAGGSPRGTEIGTYELLEQFGVRWFFPGPLGTVIPSASDLDVRAQETVQNPTFAARHFGFNALDKDPVMAQWKKHQREGGLFLPPAHGIKLGADGDFATHPEFYSLVDGERVERQVCLSNPEVLSRAVRETRAFFKENPEAPWLGMGPNDSGGFCQCTGCVALDSGDWDPFSSDPSVTDRYIWFFNQVLAGIKDEYPDKKIAFYIYHTYMRPPVKVKPDPRIVGAFAPIGLCRIHGMNNPVCPEKGYLKGLVNQWKKILPEVYERAYWFNLADPGMLFVQIHRLRDEIPYYAREKCAGFRTEVTPQWAVQGPSLYVAGKLMWNADADPDAMLRDFCEKLFGPAGGTMTEYFTFLDHRLRDGDHHTGSAFNLLQFFPGDVRAQVKALLGKAANQAVETPYKERLEIFALGFDHMDAFARMIEARDRQDWGAAHAALGQMDALRARLVGYDPPMLSRQAESYLRRFYRLPVEQGYARTVEGNQRVAALADRWDSLLDPQKVGEDLAYYRSGLTGGNWQQTPTFSTTWSDLGLRYYKGLAWYRQKVEIPKESVGKRLFLWFGGVDESARVWVNGKLVGTSSPSAFTPFEFDVTEVVRPGENVVAICLANIRVNELGTGGITAPGFFYAPAKGEKAQLENIKPLRETFP